MVIFAIFRIISPFLFLKFYIFANFRNRICPRRTSPSAAAICFGATTKTAPVPKDRGGREGSNLTYSFSSRVTSTSKVV